MYEIFIFVLQKTKTLMTDNKVVKTKKKLIFSLLVAVIINQKSRNKKKKCLVVSIESKKNVEHNWKKMNYDPKKNSLGFGFGFESQKKKTKIAWYLMSGSIQ